MQVGAAGHLTLDSAFEPGFFLHGPTKPRPHALDALHLAAPDQAEAADRLDASRRWGFPVR